MASKTAIRLILVLNMLARDSLILLVSASKIVRIYLSTSSLVHYTEGYKLKLDTIKNCDVSARAIQVLFRSVTRSVNTVERKI